MTALEKAFKAGYHCVWIRKEKRYIFDPAMKPGDPDGAYRAWVRASPPVDASPDAQLLPVYFGVVAVLAEVLGTETYKVEAKDLPTWARARLSELMKR